MAIPGLTIRLYLDQNMHGRLSADLRQRSFDAINAEEAGLAAATDEEQLQFATAEGRVLLTFDIADFTALSAEWFSSGRTHTGIVVSTEIKGREYGELLRRVLRLLNTVAEHDLDGTVRRLEEFG